LGRRGGDAWCDGLQGLSGARVPRASCPKSAARDPNTKQRHGVEGVQVERAQAKGAVVICILRRDHINRVQSRHLWRFTGLCGSPQDEKPPHNCRLGTRVLVQRHLLVGQINRSANRPLSLELWPVPTAQQLTCQMRRRTDSHEQVETFLPSPLTPTVEWTPFRQPTHCGRHRCALPPAGYCHGGQGLPLRAPRYVVPATLKGAGRVGDRTERRW
jgi:hypothetical protein